MGNEDTSGRLEALEAANKRLKTLAITALVLAVVVPIAAVAGWTAYLQSIAPTMSMEVDELRAQRYVVINEERQSRGALEATGDEARITLGTSGGGRVAVRAEADRGAIALAAPDGARTSLWAREGASQTLHRDAKGHRVQVGVYSGGDGWQGGLAVRGDDTETRVESNGTRSGLSASYDAADAEASLGARLQLDEEAGTVLELSTASGDRRFRRAELALPPAEERAAASLELGQLGSSLTARLAGVPRIHLQRGGTSVWESPVPRGMSVEPEEPPAAEAAEPTGQQAAAAPPQPEPEQPAAEPAEATPATTAEP